MICYKDMTFCKHHEDCAKAKECPRALTEQVQRDAEKWMKNPPIAVYVDKPDCHTPAR